MSNKLHFVALVASVLIPAANAHATVFVDDFSVSAGPVVSGALNPNWTAVNQNNEPSFTAAIGGGYLTISKPVTAAPVTNILWAVPNVFVPADFVMNVTVDYSKLTEAVSGVSINFSAGNSVQISGTTGLFSAPSLQGGFYEFSTATNYNLNSASFTGPSLDIRVTRTGNTVTEYYAPAGSGTFTELTSLTDTNLSGTATIFLSLNSFSPTSTSAQSVAFSNFSISAVPEPATSALMSVGIAGIFGFALFRRRKQA